MVSRRKILSQSRDELSYEPQAEEPEDDVWFTKEKLYKVSQGNIILGMGISLHHLWHHDIIVTWHDQRT